MARQCHSPLPCGPWDVAEQTKISHMDVASMSHSMPGSFSTIISVLLYPDGILPLSGTY